MVVRVVESPSRQSMLVMSRLAARCLPWSSIPVSGSTAMILATNSAKGRAQDAGSGTEVENLLRPVQSEAAGQQLYRAVSQPGRKRA